MRIKRVYDAPAKEDGYRILVDRLWPRGLAKEKAKVDLWLKEISPSNSLRKWFGHDPKKWDGFRKKYADELKSQKAALEMVKRLEKENGVVTLVYAARDEQHSNAAFLLGLFKG